MLLSELPVELRSKIYFHSDSAALLGVWRLRALRPLRLPPRARATALRGFCALLAEQLSDEALADLLGDDALNAEEALVSAVALPRGLAGHVRWGLLPGRWEGARPRRGPGVQRWQSRRIERPPNDLVGTFFLAGTGGSRVFSALLGGGVVEWDVLEGREVRRLAPRLMACSLSMAAWGQQLALGQTNGRVAMFHVAAGVCVQELFAGDDVVRCLASAGGYLVTAGLVLRVWRLFDPERWELVGSARCHSTFVRTLLTSFDADDSARAVSGSDDGTLSVLDVASCWPLWRARTLAGLMDLAAHGDRVFSLHWTGQLNEWALDGLALLRTVLLPVTRYAWCYVSLVACGDKLVCGGTAYMAVLNARTLALERKLPFRGVVRPLHATRDAVVGILLDRGMHSSIVSWH